MSKYVRTYACTDCGTATSRRRGTDDPLICSDCSLQRIADTCRQLAAKSGPAYDRWLTTAGPQGRPRKQE